MQDTPFAPKRANVAPEVVQSLAGMVGYAKCKGKNAKSRARTMVGGRDLYWFYCMTFSSKYPVARMGYYCI